jgi:hypothetical protein
MRLIDLQVFKVFYLNLDKSDGSGRSYESTSTRGSMVYQQIFKDQIPLIESRTGNSTAQST